MYVEGQTRSGKRTNQHNWLDPRTERHNKSGQFIYCTDMVRLTTGTQFIYALKCPERPREARSCQTKRPHNTRQLEPQCPSRPEIAGQKTRQHIPDSWSPSVPRGPKSPDKKTDNTRQLELQCPSRLSGPQPASQAASPPASQPSAGQACSMYPCSASLGLSM